MEVTYKMAQKVQFVETVLRDANQSLIATRLPFEKFAPMLETIDKAGYYAAECIRRSSMRRNIEMPIADIVWEVLYNKASARKAMQALTLTLH